MNSNSNRTFTVRKLLDDKNRAEIARRIGVSRCLPSMWYRGECFPSEETRARLAAYFGLNPSQIVPEEGEAA